MSLPSVGWVARFAFQVYDANRQFVSAGGCIQIYAYDPRAGRPSAYNFADLVAWQNGQARRLNSAIKTMVGGLLVGTIGILSFGWAKRRWKQPANQRERPTSKSASKKYNKADEWRDLGQPQPSFLALCTSLCSG